MLWSLVCLSSMGFSQTLVMDATYFDDGIPYKIERKYTDEESIMYVRHDNRSSVGVRRRMFQKQDTTVMQETYFGVIREETKLEKFLYCDSWTTSPSITGDTVQLKGYSNTEFGDEFIVDTLLTGKSARESWNFLDEIKTARIPSIVDGSIVVSLDSLSYSSSFTAYFVGGIPVKINRLNREGAKHAVTTCEALKNMMVCKSYFFKDTLQLFKTDSIIWNNDTTKVNWKYTRFEWGKTFTTDYKLNQNEMTTTNAESIGKIEYSEGGQLFRNLLINRLIYNDVQHTLELRLFDRQKMVNVVSANGDIKNNQYVFDKQNRVVEQKLFHGQNLFKRVVYSYPEN